MLLLVLLVVHVPSTMHQDIPPEIVEENKGYAYREHIFQCMSNIFRSFFRNSSFTTVVFDNVTQTPQYEIAQDLLKIVHEESEARNWTWEVMNAYHSHLRFVSFELCYANCNKSQLKRMAKRYYKAIQKSDNYFIIIDELANFEELISNITKMTSYNANANFLVYYDKLHFGSQSVVAKVLLQVMYTFLQYRSVVLMPNMYNVLNGYSYNIFGDKVESCGHDPEFEVPIQCKSGNLTMNKLDELKKVRQLNCSINVILRVNPPLVISEHEGIEIEILKVIEVKLNISFAFQLEPVSSQWGRRITVGTDNNCINQTQWTGGLGKFATDPFLIGVGHVAVKPQRMMDFDFTFSYYMESIVWIVPTADVIPPWANIITIFRWQIWLALGVTILIIGYLFYYLALLGRDRELNYLKSSGAGLLISVEIVLSAAVASQPRSNPVRTLFIIYALLMIIISCIYQSCLINVLTHPRYQHQIDSEDEVFESGIGVGGLADLREMFNNPPSVRDMRIFNTFEIYEEINDTEYQWMLTVAQDRDTITMLPESFAKYFIDHKDPLFVNRDGTPKIHLIKDDVLFTDQVSMVFSKGFILGREIDEIVIILCESGLIQHWQMRKASQANNATGDLNDGDDDASDGIVVITLAHLQGAFAFLCVGLGLAVMSFLSEHLFKYVQRLYWRLKLCNY